MTPLQQLIERCRRQQQQKPGQLEIPDVLSYNPSHVLSFMAIYREQADFMMTLRVAAEGTWASAEEALEEWRSRTLPDWGFASSWID